MLAHLGKGDKKSGFGKGKPDGGSIEDVGLGHEDRFHEVGGLLVELAVEGFLLAFVEG